jgi:hypothetical protein
MAIPPDGWKASAPPSKKAFIAGMLRIDLGLWPETIQLLTWLANAPDRTFGFRIVFGKIANQLSRSPFLALWWTELPAWA